MKTKITFLLLFSVLSRANIPLNYYFCSDGSYQDEYYFNLFAQEIIDDTRYYPFLLTMDEPFYTSHSEIKNENIEEWQKYFGLTYEETKMLVFDIPEEELQAVLNGTSTNLQDFLTPDFTANYRQALEYLAYAKYLEPYMRIKEKDDDYSHSWNYYSGKTVADLSYDKVISVLKQGWKGTKDNELRLRYGYQLVRFAHYYLKNQEAIDFFDKYVDSLPHNKTIMYYYALDQKSGAERSLGNIAEANAGFFEFFMNTKNKKSQAYLSLKIHNELDLNSLLANAKTPDAKNDVYLLMGYNDFNNPLSSLTRITENSPNAIQAKVLLVRAINQIERSYLEVNTGCPYNDRDCLENIPDRRLPLSFDENTINFLNETLTVIRRQLNKPNLSDKSFWNLSVAYLYLLKKDYTQANAFLQKSDSNNSKYQAQKNKLTLLLKVLSQNEISPDFENGFLTDQIDLLDEKNEIRWGYDPGNSTGDFIKNILANRYYLQGDHAKSYLLHNTIKSLEQIPDLKLLEEIERFYQKPNKNAFERYLISNLPPQYRADGEYERTKDFDFKSYSGLMKGNIYLTQGDFVKAKKEYDKVEPDFIMPRLSWQLKEGLDQSRRNGYDGFSHIPASVFNTIPKGVFNQKVPNTVPYHNEFPFIKNMMDKSELTEALIQLEKIGRRKSDKAAKANYLLGNFFYNTTSIGYYRHLFNFDIDNRKGNKYPGYYSGWSWYYGEYEDHQDKERLYYKNFGNTPHYQDDFEQPEKYIHKGLSEATDKELTARLLFAAAQIEQGQFYKYGPSEFDEKTTLNRWSDEYKKGIETYRIKNYRTNFKKLKEGYADTQYYQEAKSACKSFDYYITDF